MGITPDLRYVRFVAARHTAYSRRLDQNFHAENGWCPEDPVVNTRRFTNVFRLLDRGTQFVQKDLLNDPTIGFDDALFRAFIYRYTNTPEPWIAFKATVGRYPTLADVRNGDLRRFWTDYHASGKPIFGNAYKMFVGSENKGKTRLQWVMEMADLLPARISGAAYLAASLSSRNEMLREMPRCQDFMSMQIMADLEDSPWIGGDGNGYIIPGPGAVVGAAAMGVGKNDVVHLIHNLRHAWTLRNVTLPGTTVTPSLMDVQNTLCEFGKYVRWSALDNTHRQPYAGKHAVAAPFIPIHLIK